MDIGRRIPCGDRAEPAVFCGYLSVPADIGGTGAPGVWTMQLQRLSSWNQSCMYIQRSLLRYNIHP